MRLRLSQDPKSSNGIGMSSPRRCVEVASFNPVVDRSQVGNFVKSNNIRYPTIVLEKAEGDFTEVMNSSELAACKGNAQDVLARLREKGIMQQQKQQVTSSL